MFIKKIHLENWCQHRDVEFVLTPGVNGILGANGNGKSNFLDAIRFIHTGESINPGGKEDNLTWGTEKGRVVEVVVINDVEYTISRNIHDSGARLTWVDPATNKAMDIRKVTEVQAELNRLLGTNPTVLLDAVFVPQGKIDGILFQKNTERLKEFQQAFGLAAAADAFRLLGEEADAFQLTPGLQASLRDAVTQFQATLADAARVADELREIEAKATSLAPLEDVLRRYDEAQRHSQAFSNATRAVETAIVEERRLDAVGRELQEKCAAAMSSVASDADALPALRQHQAELLHLKANHDRYAAAAASRNRLKLALSLLDVVTDEEVVALTAKAAEATTALQRVQGMLAGTVVRPQTPTEVETQKAFLDLQASIQIRQGKGIQWSPELVALREQARDLKRHIDHFTTGKCPTCGQDVAGGPVEAEKRRLAYEDISTRGRALEAQELAQENAALAQMMSQRDALNAQLKMFRDNCTAFLNQQLLVVRQAASDAGDNANRAAQLLQHRKQITAQLSTFELSMGPEIPAPDPTAIALNAATITNIETAVMEAQNLRRLAADAQSRHVMQVKATQDAIAARDALNNVMVAPSDQEVAEARQSVPVLLQLRQAVSKLQADTQMLKVLRDTRDQACTRLRAQVATEAKHAEWVQLVRASRDVLHVGQLPKLIMQEYGKILNSQLDYSLEKFQAPFQCWLDEDLQFRAVKNGEQEMDALRLSGAEKIVASVSFRMAMSDTFASQVGLLVLDEPSNYLDKTNIQNLQQVLLELKKMSAHTGRQVLVVTHEDKLTGFFDHCITVGSPTKEE
jgi:DNA repair exonuclease SbcCD ATPase subunit